MPTLKVYLVDNVALTVKADVKSQLESVFTRLIARAGQLKVTCGIDTVDVRWVTNCPTVNSDDLLIYFSSPPSGQGGFVCNQQSFGTRGLTSWNAQGVTRSDIFVPACAPGANPMAAVLGNLAFHEGMHNKLQMTNAQLHPHGGMAGATVGAATSLTDNNVRQMAPALTNRHAQDASGMVCLPGSLDL